MKFGNIKATLVRCADLSRTALTQLTSWSRGRSYNPSVVQVATAINSNGKTVCHCTIEPCYVLASAPNPLATELERYLAGEVIENALLSQAQLKGISRMLIVLPDDFPSEPNERLVRVLELKVPQIEAMQGVDCVAQSPAAYLN